MMMAGLPKRSSKRLFIVPSVPSAGASALPAREPGTAAEIYVEGFGGVARHLGDIMRVRRGDRRGRCR